MKHFLSKVDHIRKDADGNPKRVSSQVIVKAVSLTDAEASITEALAPELQEMNVSDGKPVVYADIFHAQLDVNEADNTRWHEAKVQFVSVDDSNPAKPGKEKKVTQAVLIEADTVDLALERLHDEYVGHGKLLVPYRVTAVREIAIDYVIKHY
jgi:hypothetical protein